MNHDDALAQATQYRDLLVTKLQERGFTLTRDSGRFEVCQNPDPATIFVYMTAEAGSKKDGFYCLTSQGFAF